MTTSPPLIQTTRFTYGADPEQFGELRLPSGDGPHPAIVYVHGGGYRAAVTLSGAVGICTALTNAGYATEHGVPSARQRWRLADDLRRCPRSGPPPHEARRITTHRPYPRARGRPIGWCSTGAVAGQDERERAVVTAGLSRRAGAGASI